MLNYLFLFSFFIFFGSVQNFLDCPIDLVVIVDSSGSICQDQWPPPPSCQDWDYAKKFFNDLVDNLSISPTKKHMAIVQFADKSKLIYNFNQTQNKSNIKSAFEGMRYFGGNTNTYSAFNLVRKEIFMTSADRPEAQNVIVTITDGYPTINNDTVHDEVKMLEEMGVLLFAVGVTNLIDEMTLKNFSSYPRQLNKNYFTNPDYATISNILGVLTEKISCPTPAPTTLPLLQATTPDYEFCLFDIAIVLDTSGSICDNEEGYLYGSSTTCNNWENAKNFLVNLINASDYGPNKNLVGMVTFQTNAHFKWGLNRYSNKVDLIQAIKGLKHLGGWTNTADALKEARTKIFNSDGDRKKFKNIIIIVTDGFPTVNQEFLESEILNLKGDQITVLPIGVTDLINQEFLKKLSSNGSTFHVDTYSDLARIQSFLTPESCGPNNVPNLPTVTAITSGPGDKIVSCILDLVILIDKSGSICDVDPNYSYGRDSQCNNWVKVKEFVIDIVSMLDVGIDATRVGVATFSSNSQIQFNLDKFSSKKEVIEAIRDLEYEGMLTATSSGLEKAEMIFESSSKRENVNKSIVIVTNDVPNVREDELDSILERLDKKMIRRAAVGVTSMIDKSVLKKLSSEPRELNKNFFTSPSFEGFRYIVDTMVPQFCIACNRNKQNLFLMIDPSPNICPNRTSCEYWNFVKLVVAESLEPLMLNLNLISVVSGKTVISLGSSTDFTQLKSKILSIPYEPIYTVSSQLNKVFEQLKTKKRPDSISKVILFTPAINIGSNLHVPINGINSLNTKIYVYGLPEYNKEKIISLSSFPQQENLNYFLYNTYDAFMDAKMTIQSTYCSGDTIQNGVVTLPTTPNQPIHAPTKPIECSLSDIIFIVDSSGSICENDPTFKTWVTRGCENWKKLINFVIDFINYVEEIKGKGARYGLINFASDVEVVCNPITCNNIIDQVRYMDYKGSLTNTGEALDKAREMIDPNRPAVVITLTDGIPTLNRKSLSSSIFNLQSVPGIHLFSVGVTKEIDDDTLASFSSPPNKEYQNYFKVPSFQALNTIQESVQKGICN